ncbi:radical SAM protein [Novipirellula artificiosorum]|uniref:2-iminoacetate synthase n=1 Tax=Novipirellula artificiosorum TaxID=2528016 RepID=A0A5C6E1B8_9BACT|nr:radical SAM protein [Novipirellula artificiosorum]TWU42515.1 2-iminoacetate synthase [Novipirellula artificiosorum]
MTALTPSPLLHWSDWIRASDHHAEHRLKLIEQVEQALLDDRQRSDELCRQLAAQLERWRYQILNEQNGSLDEKDRSLLDDLDLHANQLRGGEPRPPRRPLDAIRSDARDSEPIAKLPTWFDAAYPLDQLTAAAKQVTDRGFSVQVSGGSEAAKRRMVLYAPLYVSSECVNHCTYCGFRYPLKINRTHLHVDQVLEQSRILRRRGFGHQLIVAGDYPRHTSTEYFVELIDGLHRDGIEVGIEIAAQSTESYAAMVDAGVRSLALYQETFDEADYQTYHIRGPKASFHWRLEAPERAAEAGIGRIGLGVLLGLSDPVADVTAMLRHGQYLRDRFPNLQLAFSLPRIHEAPDDFDIPYQVTDEMLVRLYSVCRLSFPDAELVLSTREPAALRGQLAQICITQMSAGSSTAPGGYRDQSEPECPGGPECLGEQFPVTDERSADEVAAWLIQSGFEVRWSFLQP